MVPLGNSEAWDDQEVTLSSGLVQLLKNTSPRTSLHCRFHHDPRSPSALVVEKTKPAFWGVHCSTCAQTFLPAGCPEFDFESFERAARNAKEHFDRHGDHESVLFNTPDTHPGLTGCGISIVQGAATRPNSGRDHRVRSPKGSGKTSGLVSLLRNVSKTPCPAFWVKGGVRMVFRGVDTEQRAR